MRYLSAMPAAEPEPSPLLAAPGLKLSPEELADFAERLGRVAHGPVRYRRPDGKTRRCPPLPWRVRARLRARRAVDTFGAWLCHHGREDTALALWKALRMVRD
jgi:hypothetical protein